jgi:hypothetical protein
MRDGWKYPQWLVPTVFTGAKYSRTFSMNGVFHIILRRLLCMCVSVVVDHASELQFARFGYQSAIFYEMEQKDCPLAENQSTIFRPLV